VDEGDKRSSPLRLFTVSRLRLFVQAVLFVLLVYGGFWLERWVIAGYEPSLPTLACVYGQPPADCFLVDLQGLLTRDALNHYRRLIAPVLFFVGLGLILGRMWCGWVCPLGFVQDVATRLRTALRLQGVRAGPRGRANFRAAAHGLLWPMIVLSMFIGWPDNQLYAHRHTLFRPYCQLCPGRRLFGLFTGDAGCVFALDHYNPVTQVMSCLGIATLSLFIGGMFAMQRFWCRLCPLGFLMDVLQLNRFSLVSLEKNVRSCTFCGRCAAACPLDIELIREEREKPDVTATDCDLCLDCVSACPQEDVLRAKFVGLTFGHSRGKGNRTR